MEDQKKFKVLSTESIHQFQEGISLILSKWWALQMAIENNWGGPHSRDKALEFASQIFYFFHQPNRKETIYIDDLELLLEEGMHSFNTEVEDGSIEEVAEQLMIMHEECLEGDYQSILKLKQVKAMPVPRARQDASDSDDDEANESTGNDEASYMMIDSPASLPNSNPTQIQKNDGIQEQMAEAEDGWTVVPSRKSKGRKN
ncbi:uncharacterized protein LOC130818102 [Amaranthus tricolor]|uniref:uncharacterized protein LOC130818102 n=1 Tax=Amaranthus tricolor TaxID=29722 RepID=UPI0025844CBE|nr:uncharacterized protein LOC130818102 [Amaranthus tricolor]